MPNYLFELPILVFLTLTIIGIDGLTFTQNKVSHVTCMWYLSEYDEAINCPKNFAALPFVCLPKNGTGFRGTCVDRKSNLSPFGTLLVIYDNFSPFDIIISQFHGTDWLSLQHFISYECSCSVQKWSVSAGGGWIPQNDSDATQHTLSYGTLKLGYAYVKCCDWNSLVSSGYLRLGIRCSYNVFGIYLIMICIFCFLSTTAVLMIGNCCGFCMIPKLRNVHGYMFTSYIVAYISANCMAFGSAYASQIRAIQEGIPYVDAFAVYFHLAIACWMFAVSFEVWRSLRDFNIVDRNERRRKTKKIYLRYGIFAWGTPFAIVLVLRIPGVTTTITDSVISAVTAIVICLNIIFFLLRAWTIWKNENNMNDLSGGSNERQVRHKKQFSFYLKTSLVMSIHGIGWIPYHVYPSATTALVLYGTDVLHSFLMFYFFVWRFSKPLIREKCATLFRRRNAGNERSAEQETGL